MKIPRYSREDLDEACRFHQLIVHGLKHKPTTLDTGETVCEVCVNIPRRRRPATWPCSDHLIIADYLKSHGFEPGSRIF